ALASALAGALACIMVMRRANSRQAMALADQLRKHAALEERYRELIAQAGEKEKFVRAVIDAVPHRVFVKDREGRYVLVNRARAEWSGQKVEEIEGKLERELNSHSEQVAGFQKDDLEVMNTLKEKIVAEEKVTNRFGRTVWLQTIKRPLISADGKAYQVLGISTDISERKRTEIFLNSILENLPVAVFMKDAKDLRFVLWNKANEELCGVSKEEILGKTDHDFFPKDQADFFNAKDRETLQSGSLVEMEEEILTRHRGVRIFRTRKIPILDESGQPLHLLGISEDITDRKRAEIALAQEREMLRSLMDSSPDCIYFKDKESRFIRTSRAFTRFGQDPEKIVGKTDFDLFAEAHARPAFEDEQEIMRTGEPIIGKVEREVMKGGEERWALSSKMPLRNATGEIVGTFGISKDITPMKQAEAKLEQVHKQLLETSRQAGMAEVATSVLHNVGNVLNSINISASLISDHLKRSKINNVARIGALMYDHTADLGRFFTQDPKGQQLPGYITQLAEHLVQEQAAMLCEVEALKKNIDHVKDIVAMQQSYAKVCGVTEPVKPEELIEDALRMNASALERHEVRVIRDYAADLPQIVVEKHKVLQILVNLIRNAKIACDESGRSDKQITARARMSSSGEKVCIDVIDNGVGIPAENLTRIFNHGFTTRKDGHGFGLHSGALAARELGGALSVQSDGQGTGATFTLELPRMASNSMGRTNS
ncbi:MAG TPA: PAS domain-containing protein, partial [Clostridia bacterium]|nr:PAS domain-containing protein [Clostridia bacterium]